MRPNRSTGSSAGAVSHCHHRTSPFDTARTDDLTQTVSGTDPPTGPAAALAGIEVGTIGP